MRIRGLIWLDEIIGKLDRKYGVHPREVYEVLTNRPQFRYVEKGHRRDENVYAAGGRTNSGRRSIVFFISKSDGRALILSARPMSAAERRRYEE